MLVKLINDYMRKINNGTSSMSEEILDDFAAKCRAALDRKCNPKEEDNNVFRMSALGRPLCQLHHQAKGTEGEEVEVNLPLKMMMGDMTEAALVAMMKAAEIDFVDCSENVEYDSAGVNISGRPDIIFDGKVWDIKTASPYAFTKKFSSGGFHEILADDAFGYIAQGYLYSAGTKLPFGGWLAINKASGEIATCETPIVDNAYRKSSLQAVDYNVKYLKENLETPVERCFPLENETFGKGKKPTGNKILGVTCSYCKFKQTCWGPVGEVRNLPQPASSAASPRKLWYVGEVKGIKE